MKKRNIALLLTIMICMQLFTPACFADTTSTMTADKITVGTMTADKMPDKQYIPPNPSVYPDYSEIDPSILINQSDTNSYSFSLKDLNDSSSSDSSAQSTGVSKIVQLETTEKYNSGKTEKVLVVPIEYTNVTMSAIHNKAYYENEVSKLKAYYEQNSGYVSGVKGFTIDATIYYPDSGAANSGNTEAFYGAAPNDENAYLLAENAYDIVKADPTMDLSSYDTDNNGEIDHVVIIHAGLGQEDPNGYWNAIWSHSSALGAAYGTDTKLYSYIIIPEICDLGTIAHEFGHDIGLPDLYDADSTTNGYSTGAGYWDVMALGCWNGASGAHDGSSPANLSAWCRYYMGWLTPSELSSEGTISLTNNDGMSSSYIIWPEGNKSAGEYYLVEYRRQIGYDVGLPAEGVLVWHVDDKRIRTVVNIDPVTGENLTVFDWNIVNGNSSRLGVAVEQADGLYELENNLDGGDAGDPFPGSTFKNAFSSLPYGMNYSNITPSAFTCVDIENIETLGSKATMDVFYNDDELNPPVAVAPYNEGASSASTTFVWTPVPKAKDYRLQIDDEDAFATPLTIDLISSNKAAGQATLIGDNLAYTVDPETGGTLSFASGATVYWKIGAVDEQGTVSWSTTYRYLRYESAALASPPAPSETASSETSVDLSWTDVDSASGYYVLADGKEIYSDAATCTVTDLDPNKPHYFKVKAINSGAVSDWSSVLTAYTAIPSITVDASAVIEGKEDSSYLDVTLSDASFLDYGEFNEDTVSLDLGSDIVDVDMDSVSRMSSSKLRIYLDGNSTADYDPGDDISVSVTIDKDILSCNRITSITGTTTIAANDESTPPAVSFSFSGTDANKLKGITASMVYSLNGGTTYTAATQDKVLTSSELNTISSANDILVKYIHAAVGDEQLIDILPGPTTAPAVTADDTANTINNITTDMDFSTNNSTWTRYTGSNLPSLTGTLTIYVRTGGVGTTLPGSTSAALSFTAPASVATGGSGGGGGGGGAVAVTNPAEGETVTVSVPDGAKEQSATLSAAEFSKMVKEDKGLTVSGKTVTILVPADAINSSLLNNAESNAYLKVSMNEITESKADSILPETDVNNASGLFSVGGRVFEFTSAIVSNSNTQLITSFASPLTINIKLDAADLTNMNANKLGVYYYNETTQIWEYMGGTYNAKTGVMTFTTTHFSLYSVMEYDKTFSDIQKHWAKEEIEIMASKHIAKGTGEEFNPNNTITRAEFTALLIRALNIDTTSTASAASYRDVSSTKWYSGEIGTAYAAGILAEGKDMPFRPDAAITREEMSVMVVNAMKLKAGASILTDSEISATLANFNDASQVSEASRDEMATALKKGILKGRNGGMLAPAATSTRAESVVIIKRLLDAL